MEETRPLFGKKIVVTRAKEQAPPFVKKIEKLGGTAIVVPLLKFQPPENNENIKEACEKLAAFDWLVFTSINGVRFFFQQFTEIDKKQLHRLKIAVVGAKTEQELQKHGFCAEFVPDEFVAESFADALIKNVQPNEKVLFPHGNLARPVIPERLREAGIEVFPVVVYETAPEKNSYKKIRQLIEEESADYITFTSSSTVDYFAEAIKGLEHKLSSVKLCGIGPITEQTALKHQLKLDIVAKEYTTDGLLEAIISSMKEMER